MSLNMSYILYPCGEEKRGGVQQQHETVTHYSLATKGNTPSKQSNSALRRRTLRCRSGLYTDGEYSPLSDVEVFDIGDISPTSMFAAGEITTDGESSPLSDVEVFDIGFISLTSMFAVGGFTTDSEYSPLLISDVGVFLTDIADFWLATVSGDPTEPYRPDCTVYTTVHEYYIGVR